MVPYENWHGRSLRLVGFTEGPYIQQQAANNWHAQRRDTAGGCCLYRCHISTCLRQFADSNTKVLGRWRRPFLAYALGRPCFATYKVSTCQFSYETIQKLKSYLEMFGFPRERITLYYTCTIHKWMFKYTVMRDDTVRTHL
jgi:hypothetical protein